jgi:hypothetical protein
MINKEQERQWPQWRRNANPSDLLRIGIIKLNGKHSEVVFASERAQHSQMASTDGIAMHYLIVKQCYAHGTPSCNLYRQHGSAEAHLA